MQREKATPGGIAQAFVGKVAKGHDELIFQLRGRGFDREEPERFRQLEFAIECLLFEAFPVDVVISDEFGRYSDTIRREFAVGVVDLMQGMAPSHVPEVELHTLRAARFFEYSEVLRSGEGGQTLQRLGIIAWERILGRSDPRASMWFLLVVRAVATFKFFKGFGAKFEMIG